MVGPVLFELYNSAMQLLQNDQGHQRWWLGILLLGTHYIRHIVLNNNDCPAFVHELLSQKSQTLRLIDCAIASIHDPTDVLGVLYALL